MRNCTKERAHFTYCDPCPPFMLNRAKFLHHGQKDTSAACESVFFTILHRALIGITDHGFCSASSADSSRRVSRQTLKRRKCWRQFWQAGQISRCFFTQLSSSGVSAPSRALESKRETCLQFDMLILLGDTMPIDFQTAA